MLSPEGFRLAEAVIRQWPGYAPTTLVSLGGIAVTSIESYRSKLNLDQQSRILVFGTEGATDAVLYQTIVGRLAEDMQNRQ